MNENLEALREMLARPLSDRRNSRVWRAEFRSGADNQPIAACIQQGYLQNIPGVTTVVTVTRGHWHRQPVVSIQGRTMTAEEVLIFLAPNTATGTITWREEEYASGSDLYLAQGRLDGARTVN